MRGEWGHLGTFEFALGARNLDLAIAYLVVDRRARWSANRIQIEMDGGRTWRYAYFRDPGRPVRYRDRGASLRMNT